MLRRSLILPLLFLLPCLAVLPACKKSKPTGGDSGGGGGGDTNTGLPGPTGPTTTAGGSDYVLFAHLRAKDIIDSPLFAEVKQAFVKAGGAKEWDELEGKLGEGIGGFVKPTDIESVTVCITEMPDRGEPKIVLIVAAGKPIDKNAFLRNGPKGKTGPDARGFYPMGQALAHFPDDKTLAIIHTDLSQRYLDGYAKNKAGWPMTPELSKAAAGHSLFASIQPGKLPSAELPKDVTEFVGPFLSAKTVTLTADLKGKEITAAVRATFPDTVSAGKAKDAVGKLVNMLSGEIEKVAGKGADLGAFAPAITEAQRTLKELKVTVSGTDLTVSGGYKVTFDIGAAVADAVVKVRDAAARMKASNNLKMIGISLHAYHDVHQQLPVHATGAKGMPLKANEKPLVSWRVAILPYIEQQNLYQQFKLDEPWDSEHNKKLIPLMPKIYEPVNKPVKLGYTHLQMVIGPNAMPPVGTRMLSITDGLSNTVAVVEAAEPVIWTKPDDVMLPGKELPKDFRKKFGGLNPGGFNALLWDGSVRFVSDKVSDRTLSLALNPNDGQPLGSDWGSLNEKGRRGERVEG